MDPGESGAPRPNRAIAAIGVLAGLFLAVPASHACSCFGQDYTVDYENAIYVVSGELVEAHETGPDQYGEPRMEMTYLIHAIWKGPADTRFLTVQSLVSAAACGFEAFLDGSADGSKQLVFAFGDSGAEHPWVQTCASYAYQSPRAEIVLAWLGEPTVVPVEGATWGRIKARYGGDTP